MLFPRDRSCFNFSLIYCEGLMVSIITSFTCGLCSFPNLFISQSLHSRYVSAFSIALVNSNLADLLNDLR